MTQISVISGPAVCSVIYNEVHFNSHPLLHSNGQMILRSLQSHLGQHNINFIICSHQPMYCVCGSCRPRTTQALMRHRDNFCFPSVLQFLCGVHLHMQTHTFSIFRSTCVCAMHLCVHCCLDLRPIRGIIKVFLFSVPLFAAIPPLRCSLRSALPL